MAIFTVHIPPGSTGNAQNLHDDVVLVPDAPSLWALVFPFFWLVWYRLWWAALFYAMLTVLLFVLMSGEFALPAAVLTIFPGLFLFLEGQDLRRKKFARAGWKSNGVIEEQDLAAAEYRYFLLSLENQEKSPAPSIKQVSNERPERHEPIDTGIEFPGSTGFVR